jgi:hypothetical protein
MFLLGVDQTPLRFRPPKAGLNSNPCSYKSDEQGSQVGSQAFLGSFVLLKIASSVHQEGGSLPSDQHVR